MKVHLDKKIENQIPLLKYVLLVLGVTAGFGLLGWLSYCLLGEHEPANEIVGILGPIVGGIIMGIILCVAFDDDLTERTWEMNFRNLAVYLFKIYGWIAGTLLGLILLFVYAGGIGFVVLFVLGFVLLMAFILKMAVEGKERK